jgi:hypothetical protein
VAAAVAAALLAFSCAAAVLVLVSIAVRLRCHFSSPAVDLGLSAEILPNFAWRAKLDRQ